MTINKSPVNMLIATALYVTTIGAMEITWAANVKHPEGWGVQYVDASCIVNTTASGAEKQDAPWYIKMGYLHGNQLILIFSISNGKLPLTSFPKSTQAWFVVDSKKFESIGISNIKGELILSVENGVNLQKAMAKAKKLGIQVKFPGQSEDHLLGDFALANIKGAAQWLNECAVIGIGAFP